MYWAIVVAFVAFGVVQVACYFVIGLMLIGFAMVQAWIFVDDPAPGLRGVRLIVDVVFGVGTGTLIAGSAIWLAFRMVRTAIAWTRGLGPELLQRWSAVTGLRP